MACDYSTRRVLRKSSTPNLRYKIIHWNYREYTFFFYKPWDYLQIYQKNTTRESLTKLTFFRALPGTTRDYKLQCTGDPSNVEGESSNFQRDTKSEECHTSQLLLCCDLSGLGKSKCAVTHRYSQVCLLSFIKR